VDGCSKSLGGIDGVVERCYERRRIFVCVHPLTFCVTLLFTSERGFTFSQFSIVSLVLQRIYDKRGVKRNNKILE